MTFLNPIELCHNEIASEVLQSLLLVLAPKSPKLCKDLAKFLTNETFASDTIDFENGALTRLMESILQVSGSDESMLKIYKHFYENVFKGNLSRLAVHPKANFSVQKLLQHCPKKEMVSSKSDLQIDFFKKTHFKIV